MFRSLLPALKPQRGALLVAVNFFAYAVGSLVHPRFLMLRRRACFGFAALAHAQWILIVLLLPASDDTSAMSIAIAAISSIVNGFGAGTLWACQGTKKREMCVKIHLIRFFFDVQEDGSASFVRSMNRSRRAVIQESFYLCTARAVSSAMSAPRLRCFSRRRSS